MKQSGWPVMVVAETFGYLASATECVRVPVTTGAYERPGYLLDKVAALMHGHPAGVLILDGAGLRKTWRAATTAKAGRVIIGPPDGLGWSATVMEPWTTWRSGERGRPAIHVGFLDEIREDRSGLIPPGNYRSQEELGIMARRLAWYHDRIGGPYFMTAGVAGHGAIRAAFGKPGRGRQPFWGARDWSILSSDVEHQGAGDLMWKRAPTRTEFDMGWVHGFDLNAARLSAMGVAEYAYNRLTHTGPIAFDPALAGYWHVPATAVRAHKRHVPVVDPGAAVAGVVEVTSPIMKHWLNLGRLPEVVDSWTAPASRMFRTTAERWNRARVEAIEQGRRVELAAVKATYREAAGLLAKRGGSIYRGDWYHTMMDQQRVTMLCHIDRVAETAGRRPLAVHTDCLWYASADADPRATAAVLGLRLGTGLGTFRIHSATPAKVFFKVKESAR